MPQTTFLSVRREWQGAWQVPAFRRRTITGLTIIIAILSSMPTFFQYIERRHGIQLNDPVLAQLVPHNVSLPLFIVIWALSGLYIYRAAQTPQLFLNFVWAYIILLLFRAITIFLIPLDPPTGLIPLVDPLSNFFYGDKFVTKDLFFSGHTSTVFLMYLSLPRKTDRNLAVIATTIVGVLLLVQHVHYTFDVLGGLLFAWLARRLAIGVILR
jgi:membrane-associated phospholipid phosphatase